MQPTDSFNIVRRPLDVEDYIDIVRRHKGWIFGPFLFCLVATVVGVLFWPDRYVSEARIKITPQQVPESMVPSANTQQIWERIESIKANILSRSTLVSIIQNKGLYKKELARLPQDDVVEEMRSRILVLPLASLGTNRAVPVFAIQFSYENRYLAQSVVQDLMGKFIEANLHNNSDQTWQSTQFFKDEAERAKKDLDESENKLTQFQVQNHGHLPDEAEANMRSLMAAEAQLTMLNGNVSRANSEKLQLESNLNILKDQRKEVVKQSEDAAPALVAPAPKNERLAEAERDFQHYEDRLRELRQKYQDGHPDVQTAIGQLAIARQKRDDLQQEDAAKREEAKKEEAAKREAKTEVPLSRSNPVLARDIMERDLKIRQTGTMIEAKDLEIAEINRDIKHTSDGIKNLQSRLETGFIGGKTYTDLIRDREMAKTKYMEADDKLAKAQRSQHMEDRRQGEHLEVLDAASLPTDPTEPKRPLVISIGAGIGLLLGIAIAGAREMKDTSLKNLKDVRAYTQMAVLGSIPLLENDFVVKRRRRLAWLGWTTACLVAVVVMVGATVYYFSTRGGVQ